VGVLFDHSDQLLAVKLRHPVGRFNFLAPFNARFKLR
jgi:hypothetical protein